MSFEEQLVNLEEEEIFGQEKEIELEGSKILEHLEYLHNLLRDVADNLTAKETITHEEAKLIDKEQMEVIQHLGEMLKLISRNK